MWLFILMTYLTQATADSELIRRGHGNPEAFMNISEKILYKGYPSEEYEVLTADGYYLSMNRIPHGKGNPRDTGPKLAALLLHGLLLDGSNWVANLPNNSLGFILADAGYDVWIGNSRGNTWSRKHQNLSIDQEEFWDFSFHEMAMYDLPALIDFILQKTGQQNLYYIGYSQGCTIAFIAFSAMPQLAQKIKIFFALAPAYMLNKSKAPLTQLIFLPTDLLRIVFGKKEFCLLSTRLKSLTAKVCGTALVDRLCIQTLFFILGGFNEKNLNVSRADVYLASFPDYTSVKNIIHWGQTTPPFYKVEDMTVPTALWNGGRDLVTSPQATAVLLPRLTNLVFYKYFPDWTHVDFIWGLDATQRMYDEILELMEKHP
ncbi:lipase member M-like isoform X2 [Malaclemys terrapin pileata]|uniref:lipase member M-like isoform X2 n=1 Tax=Malaclemys terrapin pileata TaxID=2991368 RepID=UPI0023A7B3EF|nr:lipase member M-like isoform X2 [Malaclemys terrapin pileata]